jgi:predicted lipoprotein
MKPLLTAALIFALASSSSAQTSPVEISIPGAVDIDHRALQTRALAVLESQFGAFRSAAADLEKTSVLFCAGALPRDEYLAVFRTAWLAWAPLDSYQFGPVEQSGAALRVNFWPDKKNFTGRALHQLLKATPKAQSDPAFIARGSAAAQGLPAIERLLFTDAEECPAITGISANLSDIADGLYTGWFSGDGWADLVRAAGPDNPVYLNDAEFTKTLYTALHFGLTRVGDARLGRPLGSFDRPFPKRAEAWRAGLTADIMSAQISGVSDMLRDGFGAAVPSQNLQRALDTFAAVQDRLHQIGAPVPEAVIDPALRIRVESLQNRTLALRSVLNRDIGARLKVETGFSAADGD